MSRPSKRDDVVKAAARLIADHGLSGVNVRDIAKAAGVRAASVYRLFESKEHIFSAVLQYAWSDAAERRQFLNSDATAVEKVKTIIYLAISEMDELEIVTKMIQRALVDHDMETLEAYKSYQSDRLDLIVSSFREISRDKDPNLLMNLTLGTLFGYMDRRPFFNLIHPLSEQEKDPMFLTETILGMSIPWVDWKTIPLAL